MVDLAFRPLWEGLAQHAWTEEQLEGFARRLDAIRIIDQLQTAIRGERNVFTNQVMALLQKDPSVLKVLQMGERPSSSWNFWPAQILAGGLYNENRTAMGRECTRTLACLDAPRQRVDPLLVARLGSADHASPKALHPHTFLARLVMPAYPNVLQRAAAVQATVQLARIAVALERQRLRTGSYPETPDATWPADPASGAPPHYAQQFDGTFTLYYDGWNRLDDGGSIGWTAGQPPQPDSAQGDWVWPRVSR